MIRIAKEHISVVVDGLREVAVVVVPADLERPTAVVLDSIDRRPPDVFVIRVVALLVTYWRCARSLSDVIEALAPDWVWRVCILVSTLVGRVGEESG